MTTSSSANADVSVARWPILSRCFSIETPCASIGTTNAVRPLWPLDLSVDAKTVDQAAWPAFVMNIFEPFRTYSSPRRSAVVLMRAASEPASGSLSANEHRIGSSRRGGSHSRFCSSEPAISTGPAPSVFATIETAIPEQPQESSSPMSMPSKPGRPGPPYSSGMWTFISPSSCAFWTRSAGWVWCSSYSAAFGRISLSANSRASARSSRCSGVSANEIPPATPVSVAVIRTRLLCVD